MMPFFHRLLGHTQETRALAAQGHPLVWRGQMKVCSCGTRWVR